MKIIGYLNIVHYTLSDFVYSKYKKISIGMMQLLNASALSSFILLVVGD